jgi:hypothetical protein
MKTFRLISVIIALMISSFCYSQSMPVVIGDSILGTGTGFYHRDICLDGEDNLWIGYYQQGVAKYNGESFTHFTSDNSGLGSDTINDLYFYDNVLYAATKGGLYRTNTAVSDPIWQTVEGTSGKVIYAALIKNGNLYAISGSQVEDSINELMIINLATNEIQQVLFEKIINSNNYRVEIDSDSDGNIYWNSKFAYGIYKYDGSQVLKIIEPVIDDLPRRIETFIIVDDKIWYSLEFGSDCIFIYDIEEASTIPISESSCYDSRFNYSSAFIENGGGGRVLMTSRANNFAEICVIENNTPTIYKFLDILLNPGFNSVILNADNRIYFSGLGFNQLYSFHLDNYLNFMAGYTDDNFKYLDRNQVKAGAKSYGTFFWDGQGKACYEVPAGSGTHSLFAASLWIGGYNTETNQLHMSAERFNFGSNPLSTYSYDFLTGPLTIGSGTCDTATSIDFNKIWKIDKSDILAHISNIENGTDYYVSPDLYSWPGNGPEGYPEILAPFYDADADGIYEPYQGDYPELRGDQMLWWITNDVIAPHNSTDGIPMGVEMQYTLYSYSFENPADEIEDLINYQSFLNVKISNRSVNDYDSVFVGVWTDVDLGGASDDYVSCDVSRSTFYAYNGDDFDESDSGTLGYGDFPPIQTVTILDGPYSHPDNDSIKLSKFVYFNNGSNPALNDPHTAQEYYNYLRGYWKDNSPLCYGGTGHVSGGGNPDVPTSYMFPGSPTTDPLGLGQGGVPQVDWSEETADNAPGDRRGVGSMGPFNLDSQQSVEVDILFGHIQNPNASESKGVFNYGPMLDSLINWFNAGTIPSNYNPELLQGVNNPNTASEIQLYPNPTNGILHVEATKIVDVNVYSIDGKLVKSYGKTSDIDMSNLPNGIYLISIETENERCVRKVIKR